MRFTNRRGPHDENAAVTNTSNAYCAVLGIPVPRIESARSSPDANYYGLLLVALLERGGPLTLEEAAVRFEEAGVAPAPEALASLKRCKPARPPIYRDGDHYSLDPHDDETDLWAFRLGLRPARAVPLHVVRHDSGPPRTLDQPLTVQELDEAWRDGIPNTWSAQRIAVAVLDAQDTAMSVADVLEFVRARSQGSLLRAESAQYWRHGAAVHVRDDGRWELDATHDAVRAARAAVRERITVGRRWAGMRPDPAAIKANQLRLERERHAHGEELARKRRVLIHAFPVGRPEALVLVDVPERTITTFIGQEISHASRRFPAYEIIGAIGVRPLLRALNVDPGERRLAELGPPQKTRQINRRGRTLTITPMLLARGSCGISRPFGDDRTLREYLRRGEQTKLRRRLEADAKSLYALYQYGRLHGAVRLRWGFLDEMLPAPWVHRDEPTLHRVLKEAYTRGAALDVVVGSAPGWTDPWSRVRRAFPATDAWGWPSRLVDEDGYEIPRADVQLARLADDARGTE
jgi:hypothetical protein